MNAPIIGSEALASGALTRGQLRWNYRPIFPDVYVPKSTDRSLEMMTTGAWLWSERRATITGRAAAALRHRSQREVTAEGGCVAPLLRGGRARPRWPGARAWSQRSNRLRTPRSA